MKSGLYFTFSSLFSRPPTYDFIESVVKGRLFTLASVLERSQDQVNFIENQKWLSEVERLQLDFSRLFSVPSENAVIPYESYYLDRIPIGFGDWKDFSKTAAEVDMPGYISGPCLSSIKAFYASEGYMLDEQNSELPDHIGCELEFLGLLYQKNKLEVVQNFTRKHIGRWLNTFIGCVREKAKTDFYKKGAESLQYLMVNMT